MSVNVLITVDNCYQERCHLWHSSQVDMKVFAVVNSDLRGSDDGTNHYIQYRCTASFMAILTRENIGDNTTDEGDVAV